MRPRSGGGSCLWWKMLWNDFLLGNDIQPPYNLISFPNHHPRFSVRSFTPGNPGPRPPLRPWSPSSPPHGPISTLPPTVYACTPSISWVQHVIAYPLVWLLPWAPVPRLSSPPGSVCTCGFIQFNSPVLQGPLGLCQVYQSA